MKYNKTLEEIKREYNLEFLNFFYNTHPPDNTSVCLCSLDASPTYIHNGVGLAQILIENALDLKYALHRVCIDGESINFLDLGINYTNLAKLQRDAMILSISST